MKKGIKLSVFLILILVMAISVFGCAKKTPDKTTTPGKQTEQKKPDEEQKKPNEEEKKPSEEENKPNIKKKVKIKFAIKGQNTFGEEYEKAEETESEYVSSIEKEEGDTVKPSELLDIVKEKINETIYNKDDILYKHDGEEINETQPIQVKSPNTVIEFYVKRQIRTITLNTTQTVNMSNVQGAVEIADGNKTLKFRHGYNFVGDETPMLADTEEYEFKGWLQGSNVYKFDNTNSVTSNVTLRPNMKNKIDIKFVIKGQKTFGDEYEQAEGTDAEYASNIKKKEGETVKPSELLDIVKEKINGTIYNKGDMLCKHDGEVISETQPIQVKSSNTVIEFYVKRQIRTITLDTTQTVNTSNVQGAVEIANDNKTLKFRHGYSFVGDETPMLTDTEEYEFKGWLQGSNAYKFDNTNSVTADVTLSPNMKNKIEIKFVIKGQKTFGDEYEQAEDTHAEYVSNIKKKEGQTVKASELLNLVKEKINGTIYNKGEMFYKHDGEEISATQPIQVKAPNTVIEFYVNRQIRTITLDTTQPVNISNVKGAVEIADGNKTLKFRHGYSFIGDETPIIAGTEEDEFNGWLNGQDIYRFGDPNSVTEDVTLTPNIRKRYATVNINLNGLRAEGLQYADGDISGSPDSTWTRITVRVPYEQFKNTAYTLSNLKANNEAVWYSEITQRQVRQTGYTGQTIINEVGQTYEVTATYTEEPETIYRGMYPQTKAESSEIEGTTITEEVANNEPKTGYGKFSYTIAYNKGNKFEVINGEYYKFEPVEWEEFPLETNKKWTKNTLDVSIFDSGDPNRNIYSGSYIEGYLRIMAQKMQIDYTLSLPKLGGNDALPWNTALTYINQSTAAEIKEKLKYKKVTDYATAVSGSYKTLRKITTRVYGTSIQCTWLGTRNQGSNTHSYNIDYYGTLASEYTYSLLGLRVAK